jgi:hypothetical protein
LERRFVLVCGTARFEEEQLVAFKRARADAKNRLAQLKTMPVTQLLAPNSKSLLSNPFFKQTPTPPSHIIL